MSSLICGECGRAIVDEMTGDYGSPGGYVTCCKHWPPERLEGISGRPFRCKMHLGSYRCDVPGLECKGCKYAE